MLFRKIFVIFSLVFFLIASFSLFLFNNNLKISSDSLNASVYAVSGSPNVLEITGSENSTPIILSPESTQIPYVKPPVFSQGSFNIYPIGLEPGFYQIFSGFSQGSLQIGYTVLPPDPYPVINPLFTPLVFIFLLTVALVFSSLILLKVPTSKNTLKISLTAGFLIVAFSVLALASLRVSSLAVFENKPSFTQGYPSELPVVDTNNSTGELTLEYLESLLKFCVDPSKPSSSFVSDNTTCAATIAMRATELYGVEGFNTILDSEYAKFFGEFCEIASRHSSGFTPVDPIDYDFVQQGLICNYSWLNHLTSSSYKNSPSVEEFFIKAHTVCGSLNTFSGIPRQTLLQQCSRGIGMGLYNLIKNPKTASDYCTKLPATFNFLNCGEGVFAEARLHLARQDLHKNPNINLGTRICSEVSATFYGGCIKVLSTQILEDYSLEEFKEECLNKGTEFRESCATAIGMLAYWTLDYTDTEALAKACDPSLSDRCIERFFASESLSQTTDPEELIATCLAFNRVYRPQVDKIPGETKPCEKLALYIKNYASGFSYHKSDADRR